MIVKDEQGNERELLNGDLVGELNSAGTIVWAARVVRNDLDEGTYAYVERPVRGATEYLRPSRMAWLTSDPSDDEKEPLLYDRYRNLMSNLTAARDRSYSYDSRADYNLLDRFRTLLRYPDQDPWFWQSVAESAEDPRKVSYANSPKDIDNNARRRFCSVSKFLRGKGREHGARFTDEEANRIGELVGSHFPDTYEYSFEVKRGWNDEADAGEVYLAYNDKQGEAFSSCMHGTDYVRWYDDNPEKVGIVKIMQGPKYTGRALIWFTDQGVTVVDRVYPSNNGPHTNALHRWAEANGYDYKTRQSSCTGELMSGRTDYTITMVRPESGDFPYLDTFYFTNDDPARAEKIKLNTRGGKYSFLCTGGGYNGGVRCESCEESIDEEDAHEHDGYWYCEECHNDRFVYLGYRRPNGRLVERTVYRDDVACCDHCEEYRLSSDIEEIRVRSSSGRGFRSEDWCCICIAEEAHYCSECDTNYENDCITSLKDGDPICEECFANIGSTCEECGEACKTEDMSAFEDCLYCYECAPEGAEAAEKEETRADPAPEPAPTPPQGELHQDYPAEGWAYPQPQPFGYMEYRHNCCYNHIGCYYCREIARRRQEYYLGLRPYSVRNCRDNCCAIDGLNLEEYIAAPYPNAHEREMIEAQNAPPPPPEIDSSRDSVESDSPSLDDGFNLPPSPPSGNPYWTAVDESVEFNAESFAEASRILMSRCITTPPQPDFPWTQYRAVVNFRPELITLNDAPIIWDGLLKFEEVTNG